MNLPSLHIEIELHLVKRPVSSIQQRAVPVTWKKILVKAIGLRSSTDGGGFIIFKGGSSGPAALPCFILFNPEITESTDTKGNGVLLPHENRSCMTGG